MEDILKKKNIKIKKFENEVQKLVACSRNFEKRESLLNILKNDCDFDLFNKIFEVGAKADAFEHDLHKKENNMKIVGNLYINLRLNYMNYNMI